MAADGAKRQESKYMREGGRVERKGVARAGDGTERAGGEGKGGRESGNNGGCSDRRWN